jgi:hypothetical protein
MLKKNNTSLNFPGPTKDSRNKLNELIKRNNENHNIFFNDRGFHNHLVHHLIPAYNVGATPDRLEEIYKMQSKIQRPRQPLHERTITKENFSNHLSDLSYWSDYDNFFQNLLKESKVIDVLNEYLFHNQAMYNRVFSGVIHPFIHIGYGLEYDIPTLIAEGLAMCACTSDYQGKIYSCKENISSGSSKNPRQIFDEISNDKEFANLTRYEDEDRIQDFLKRGGDKALAKYTSQWNVNPDKDDLQNKLKELFEITALCYGSLTPKGKEYFKFDFYIMHCLTSAYFLPIYLDTVTPDQGALLLKTHFSTLASFWITAGRPAFHLDNLLSYQPHIKPNQHNPWLSIIESIMITNDEHMAKSLRTLILADERYGDFNGVWLKSAQATIDCVKGVPGSGAKQFWSFARLGYEQAWGTVEEDPDI